MMYELINKIMEKAEQAKVDIGVAYDMLTAENGYNKDLDNASKFLNENQATIFKLRAKGLEDNIKELCEIAGDKDKVWKYIFDLYEKGVIER